MTTPIHVDDASTAPGRAPGHALTALRQVEGPRALRVLARLLGALLVLIFVGLWIVPWQQNIPGTGRVAAFAPFDRITAVSSATIMLLIVDPVEERKELAVVGSNSADDEDIREREGKAA